ncbi:hypothetical protein JYQ62_30195 [Nostoc sp. UHCC 0702]|nr:hypothetical protein JYQ62_30195 [Nostoc sp. UHCC 0702]
MLVLSKQDSLTLRQSTGTKATPQKAEFHAIWATVSRVQGCRASPSGGCDVQDSGPFTALHLSIIGSMAGCDVETPRNTSSHTFIFLANIL